MHHLVVCGFGNSAQRFLEEFARMKPPGFQVTVVSAEPGFGYDRIRLSHYVRDGKDAPLDGHGSEWFSRAGIRFVSGDPVVEIRLEENRVITRSGLNIEYSKLVLATGSRPRSLNVAGLSQGDILAVRTLLDAKKVRDCAMRAHSAVVIGGGVLGVELADSLRESGCTVDLVCATDRLIPSASADFSAAILDILKNKGVHVHLKTTTLRGRHLGDPLKSISLELTNDRTVTSPCVVAAIGVHSDDELARKTGLTCAETGGVQVNGLLQTSSPNIFALGEVACVLGATFAHIEPCYAMAKVLATHLFENSQATFVAPPPRLVVKMSGVVVVRGGIPDDVEEWVSADSSALVKGLHRVGIGDGRVLAYEIVGFSDAAPNGVSDIEASLGKPFTNETRRSFLASGLLASPFNGDDQFAPQRRICNCNQVHVADLERALAEGASSLEALRSTTGASTGCGACNPLLSKYCEHRFGHQVANKAHSIIVRAPFWMVSTAASIYLMACVGFSAWWLLRGTGS